MNRSLERINSMSETDASFHKCNSSPARTQPLNVTCQNFAFSLIEFIRYILPFLFANVIGFRVWSATGVCYHPAVHSSPINTPPPWFAFSSRRWPLQGTGNGLPTETASTCRHGAKNENGDQFGGVWCKIVKTLTGP